MSVAPSSYPRKRSAAVRRYQPRHIPHVAPPTVSPLPPTIFPLPRPADQGPRHPPQVIGMAAPPHHWENLDLRPGEEIASVDLRIYQRRVEWLSIRTTLGRAAAFGRGAEGLTQRLEARGPNAPRWRCRPLRAVARPRSRGCRRRCRKTTGWWRSSGPWAARRQAWRRERSPRSISPHRPSASVSLAARWRPGSLLGAAGVDQGCGAGRRSGFMRSRCPLWCPPRPRTAARPTS